MPRAGAGSPGNFSTSSGTNITQVGGASITLGQKTMANSFPVVLASDQSSIPVTFVATQTVNANLNSGVNIIGSLAANQSVNVAQIAGTNTVTAGVSGMLAVGGNIAAGSAPTANPVMVAGFDGVNVRHFLIDVSGRPYINIAQIGANAPASAGQNGVFSVGGQQATNTAVSTNGFPILIAGSDYGGTPKIQSLKVDSSGKAFINTVDTVTSLSQFPAAAALADSSSNPTTTQVGANLLAFDGTNWFRVIQAQDQDALGNNGNQIRVGATLRSYNGTNWDRVRSGIGAVNTSLTGVLNDIPLSVYNTTAPAPANTNSVPLQSDQAGNLRTFSGISLTTLAAWNSGTSLNATQTIFTNSGAPTVLIQLTQTSTITVGAITFEVSYDGSNWVSLPVQCIIDPTTTNYGRISLPYTLVASTNQQFLIEMNGAQALRIRLSTAITGSGSVTPNYALLNYSPMQIIATTADAINASSTLPSRAVLVAGYDGSNTRWISTDSGGNVIVAGNVASGAADSRNPVKVGGVFNTTQPTVTNGQRVDSQYTARGAAIVATGVDAFTVAIAAGSAVIGHVITDSGSVTNATLSAETTKVIGVVRTSDGAGNLLTTNSTTFSSKFALDVNMLGTLGTAFSTAGKVDVKGADGDVFVRQATASNLKAQVVSGDATGSAVPANAYYKAGLAKTALPTAASDGNLTGAMVDKFGRQVNLISTIRDLVGTQTTTISASTSETTIVTAGAAGIFNDLIMLIISNTSASTNTRIDFRDATAGTILFSLESIGGGAPVGFALPTPIPQTTAANNWTAQCATSTTDIRIYAVYAKNK